MEPEMPRRRANAWAGVYCWLFESADGTAEGERPPAEGERPPAEGERPPAEGERPPAE